jgi:hypothetical protein
MITDELERLYARLDALTLEEYLERRQIDRQLERLGWHVSEWRREQAERRSCVALALVQALDPLGCPDAQGVHMAKRGEAPVSDGPCE